MKTTVNQKSFLATSSNKFFKVGLGTSILLSIVAFQVPFARNSASFTILEEEIEKDVFQITYVKLPEEKVLEKKETFVVKKIVNPIIVTSSTEPLAPIANPEPPASSPSGMLIVDPPPPAPETNNQVYKVVEIMPEFVGGESALFKYIQKNIKYPIIAIENDIEGKVYIRFVINKLGEITNVEVAKSADPILDKEAVRIVKSMPNWKPGIQNGEKVNVAYVIPITFSIL